MTYTFIKVVNNRMIETSENEGIQLEWDGVFWVYYGESKMYTHEGVTYDCFPIVTISEDCDKVEDITMFGCVGENRCEDAELFDLPIDCDVWPEIRPFAELMK